MENEEKVISWKELKRKMKFAEFCNKAKEFGGKAWEHKAEIAAGAVSMGVAFDKARKLINKVREAREEKRKEKRMYIPTIHKTMDLKRKPSKAELQEFTNRVHSGEKILNVLKDMDLL